MCSLCVKCVATDWVLSNHSTLTQQTSVDTRDDDDMQNAECTFTDIVERYVIYYILCKDCFNKALTVYLW